MYEPYHSVEDIIKLEQLIESIDRNGYQGAPLVADGDCLITGAHRWAACQELGIAPPVVDIRDIYPEFDALVEEWDCPAVGEGEYAMMVAEIPASIRDEYGIDIH